MSKFLFKFKKIHNYIYNLRELNFFTGVSSREILLLFVAEITVLISYWKISSGFFQQDEWLSFGYRFLERDSGLFGLLKYAFAPSVGHYQPLTVLVLHTLFFLFGLNYFPYSVVSIVFHLFTVALVFFLAKQISQDTKFSALAALLFGITAADFQATSWVLADISIHLSTIFALLCLIFFFRFLRTVERKFFTLSLLFLVISILFKESTIGLFLLLPVTLFLFGLRRQKTYKKYLIFIGCVFFVYLLIRLSMIFIPQSYARETLVTKSQPPINLVYNIVTFPLKGISQSIIPSSLLLKFSYLASDFIFKERELVKDTTEYELLVQREIFEPVSILLSLFIILVVIFKWYRERYSILGKLTIFGLLLIFLNTPVFALSPERAGRIFIIDSRNLYFVSVGASLLLLSLVTRLANTRRVIHMVFLFGVFLFNLFWLKTELEQIVENGKLRKNILVQIKNKYLDLAERTVFYTESDKSYFGLPPTERIFPFQSGFGQTLLIWYQPQEKFPKQFFENRFLWELTDQGYQETSERGFGYFRDFEILANVIKTYKVPVNSVVAFRFDSDANSLSDSTDEIRGRVFGYLSNKKEINTHTFSVSASSNPETAHLAVDGVRQSFWDSQLPYSYSQSFDIDLKANKKVAQISIDSYTNKNQNEVGYMVLLSTDGKAWNQVFYSERYNPGADGIVNLYFKPQLARYIRIEQLGYHDFASWVIHELEIYEATN